MRTARCGRPHAEIYVGFGAGDGGAVGLRRGRDCVGCDVGCDVGCWGWCAGVFVALEELEGGGGVGAEGEEE